MVRPSRAATPRPGQSVGAVDRVGAGAGGPRWFGAGVGAGSGPDQGKRSPIITSSPVVVGATLARYLGLTGVAIQRGMFARRYGPDPLQAEPQRRLRVSSQVTTILRRVAFTGPRPPNRKAYLYPPTVKPPATSGRSEDRIDSARGRTSDKQLHAIGEKCPSKSLTACWDVGDAEDKTERTERGRDGGRCGGCRSLTLSAPVRRTANHAFISPTSTNPPVQIHTWYLSSQLCDLLSTSSISSHLQPPVGQCPQTSKTPDSCIGPGRQTTRRARNIGA